MAIEPQTTSLLFYKVHYDAIVVDNIVRVGGWWVCHQGWGGRGRDDPLWVCLVVGIQITEEVVPGWKNSKGAIY